MLRSFKDRQWGVRVPELIGFLRHFTVALFFTFHGSWVTLVDHVSFFKYMERPDLQFPPLDEEDDGVMENSEVAHLENGMRKEEMVRCRICGDLKPPRVHHCGYCQR